jgi:COMC family
MARRLLVSCSTMTKETFQTLSTQELATVGGGLGWLANRFPLAAAGLRRLAFGRGANTGGTGNSGCSGCGG